MQSHVHGFSNQQPLTATIPKRGTEQRRGGE